MQSPLRLAVAFLSLLLLVLTVAVEPAARATTTRPKDVACPACEHEFTVEVIRSYNTAGGTDLDLCIHAGGDSPYSFWVWTCPSCRFSRWSGDFETDLTPGEAARVHESVKTGPGVSPDMTQRVIPGWAKYELLGLTLTGLGRDDGVLAHAALSGAWVTRVELDRVLDGVTKHETLGPAWEQIREAERARAEALVGISENGFFWPRRETIAAIALLDELSRAEVSRAGVSQAGVSQGAAPDPLPLLFAAYRLRRRGENALATPVLERLSAEEDAPEPVQEAAKKLLSSIARERGFQEAFVLHARRALDADVLEGQRAATTIYQVSEALRRLGRGIEAPEWFLQALDHPQCPGWLLSLARERSTTPEQGAAIDPQRLDTLIRRRIALLADELADPETVRAAAGELVALRDERALLPLVAALGSEDNAVRASVARLLRRVPTIPDPTLDALGEVLESDDEDAELQAAITLVAYGSPRSAGALRVGLDSFQWRVADTCARGLGVVGDEDDIRDLVEIVEFRPQVKLSVLGALSRLANRKFTTLGAFDEWYEKHGGDPQTTWVRDGFKAAGVHLEDLEGDARTAALIDALEHESYTIRTNAFRELQRATGQRFGAQDLVSELGSPRTKQERRMAVLAWRRWLESR